MAELKIEIEKVEGIENAHYVVLDGEIGPSGAPVFASRLQQVVTSGAMAVILDLSGVTYMNSTALAALIKLEDQLEKGYLGLVGVQTSARIVMDNLGITGLFHVHKTRTEAINAARKSVSGEKTEEETEEPGAEEESEAESTAPIQTQAWMLFYPTISFAGTVQPGKRLILTLSLGRSHPDPGVDTDGVRIKDLPSDWEEAPVVVRVTSKHLDFDAGGNEGVILLRRREDTVRCTLVATVSEEVDLDRFITVDVTYLTRGHARGDASREIPVTGKSS